MDRKYIIVTGGVLSGIGKGVASASIGKLLSANYNVIPIKIDGYWNVDPGTQNPIEHGEVFVLDDGGEVDMDFGHYERFMDIKGKKEWSLTTGKLNDIIRKKEREGSYLGQTVQENPHVYLEICNYIYDIGEKENADVVVVEVGGTVGDDENKKFIKATTWMRDILGPENFVYVHLTKVDYYNVTKEQKTKPAQNDLIKCRELDLRPDIIIARCPEKLTNKSKMKLAKVLRHYSKGPIQKQKNLFTIETINNRLDISKIINGIDIDTIYEIPLLLEKEGILDLLYDKIFPKLGRKDFKIHHKKLEKKMSKLEKLVKNIKEPKKTANIAICGKHTDLEDSYASIREALIHASANLNTKTNIIYIDPENINDKLKNINGLIIPGGQDSTGAREKVELIKYVRENKIPFLGINFGYLLSIIEHACNCCKLRDTNPTETKKSIKCPILKISSERLGSYPSILKNDSLVKKLYKKEIIHERYRHNYEINPEYHKILEKQGLIFSGKSIDNFFINFIERDDHPYFVGSQGHIELKSKLEKPSPLFTGLIKACLKYKNS